MTEPVPDVGAFAAAFQQFLVDMHSAADYGEPAVTARIRDHIGTDPRELPSTSAEFAPTDHPNVQLALDALLQDAELIGYAGLHQGFPPIGLEELVSGRAVAGPIKPGPVRYVDVDVGGSRVVRCIVAGVLLARHDGAPVVLALSRSERGFGSQTVRIEGISPADGAVSALLVRLRAAMREHNVYRGRVISLHATDRDEGVQVHFHELPAVAREAVILPVGTLERLERHVIGVAERAEKLRAGGRHLKRGVLLHGPPGTGKTLSINYLLAAMPGRTTVLLTGRGLGLVEQAVTIARELVPATVVLEDIDLVAAERTMPFGHSGILFELLNQIEGLAGDSDLLFVLTTNRPDLIEPALAARPGRVDLALEIPLPDEDARRRLVRLYAGDIELDDAAEQRIVADTASLTGAFIKELMRQAALRAALDDRDRPTGEDALAALAELLDQRSSLTRRLLGEGADGGGAPGPAPSPMPGMVRALGAAGIAFPEDVVAGGGAAAVGALCRGRGRGCGRSNCGQRRRGGFRPARLPAETSRSAC